MNFVWGEPGEGGIYDNLKQERNGGGRGKATVARERICLGFSLFG